ncbi:hypothetical protein CGRA01v4_06384 [Colletotrichum graminicola]|nr:hypothetical protein CGRA01v4_06384 [Colletotrichum graminicola]
MKLPNHHDQGQHRVQCLESAVQMECHASGSTAATAPAPSTGGRAAQSSSARRRVQACLSPADSIQDVSWCACERPPVRWPLTRPSLGIPHPLAATSMDFYQPGTSTTKSPKAEQGTWVLGAGMGPSSLFRVLCFVGTSPIHHRCLLATKFVSENSIPSAHSNAYRCQGQARGCFPSAPSDTPLVLPCDRFWSGWIIMEWEGRSQLSFHSMTTP